jgi:GMP synthase (glutamine-hydrolysing)
VSFATARRGVSRFQNFQPRSYNHGKPMKKVIVFQHVPHEDLGTLGPLIRDAGLQTDTIRFWSAPDAKPTLTGYRGLIVLGGPMGVYNAQQFPHLVTEASLIQRAAAANLPVLGICLGAQLIAHALGARVYPSGTKEIGWYRLTPTKNAANDLLFRHLGATESVFQWHGDTFEIPKGAVHLSSSKLCMHQAFRYGRNIYAMQFHLEVDAAMIEAWLNVAENQNEIASLGGKIDPAQILRETPAYIDRLNAAGTSVFREFIRLCNEDPKP